MSAHAITGTAWRADAIWLRLLTVSPAARYVYIVLSTALQDAAIQLAPLPGVSLAVLAAFAGMPETDARTHVASLVQAGLLHWANGDTPGGGDLITVATPQAEPQAPTPRQIASRINGLKGGRPRKSTTPPEQTSMLMPISGGLPAGNSGLSAPIAIASTLKETESKLKLADANKPDPENKPLPPDAHRIAAAAREAAGFGADTHYGAAINWIKAGATEAIILETIRAKRRPGIAHLGYYTQAIMEAVEAARQPPAEDPGIRLAKAAWQRDVAAWGDFKRYGRTSQPMPRVEDYAACAMPAPGAPQGYRDLAASWMAGGCKGYAPINPARVQQA